MGYSVWHMQGFGLKGGRKSAASFATTPWAGRFCTNHVFWGNLGEVPLEDREASLWLAGKRWAAAM